MDGAQRDTDHTQAITSAGQPLHAVRDVDSRLQRELSDQFDSVVAFADYCVFLTSGKAGVSASRLVSTAQALYSETIEDLRRSRPGG